VFHGYVLVNLLPGLRDLRAPLAAGYLLVAACYVAFGRSLRTLFESQDAVLIPAQQALGSFGAAAAISFVAYVLGILWEGLAGLRRTDILRTRIDRVKNAYRIRGNSAGRAAPLDVDRASVERLLAVDPAYRRGVEDRIFDAFITRIGGSENSEREQFLEAATVSALQSLVEHYEAKGMALGRDTTEQLESVTQVLVAALEAEDWDLLRPMVAATLDVPGVALALERDLERLPARLVGQEKEVWDSWDRLRAESEFRGAIAGPLVLLGIAAMPYQAGPSVLTIVAGFCLGVLARQKRRAATSQLREVVLAGRVDVPALETLKERPLPFPSRQSDLKALSADDLQRYLHRGREEAWPDVVARMRDYARVISQSSTSEAPPPDS
jgi:hypothetical protein